MSVFEISRVDCISVMLCILNDLAVMNYKMFHRNTYVCIIFHRGQDSGGCDYDLGLPFVTSPEKCVIALHESCLTEGLRHVVSCMGILIVM